MGYEVHLDVFDGPFDLLLQLISASQVDVYEVRLSDVVDAFCAEIARAQELDLELATEFLLIAATLVELKCRRLLPGEDDVELDEEFSVFEARDYLLARLVECKTFTAAAAALAELEQHAARAHARHGRPDERFEEVAPDLLATVTPNLLAEVAVKALLAAAPQRVDASHVHEDEVSVPQVMDELLRDLPQRKRASLRELTLGAPTPRVVACFLALLELYKHDLVDLVQHESFGELEVAWRADADGASHPLIELESAGGASR